MPLEPPKSGLAYNPRRQEPPAQRILLVISSLDCGGAERVMAIMANHWAAEGREVSLLTLRSYPKSDFYALHPAIRRRGLYRPTRISNRWAAVSDHLYCIHRLRRVIREICPDVVISFIDQTNITTLIAGLGLGIPIIVAERSNPAMVPLSRRVKKLREWTYPAASRIVVQSRDAGEFFALKLWRRVVVIPNPVPAPPADANLVEHGARTGSRTKNARRLQPSVIAMGRFTEEKRFDLLLEAFALSRRHCPEWTLVLLGDGPLRPQLEAMRRRLGIEEAVRMPGRVSDPYPVLRSADLFVLSSRFEGFPNSLCEAMACGLPVIATDCPSGPREIIRDGVDGVLIPSEDVQALAAAMVRLMASPAERMRLSARAVEITDRFGVERVMGMWERLFDDVAGKTRRMRRRGAAAPSAMERVEQREAADRGAK